jgi:hypothetical protein
MENYIKYQRFVKQTTEDKIQEFFDELIQGGWDIIYYSEFVETKRNINAQSSTGAVTNENIFRLIAVCGKKANLIKNVL